MTPVAVSPVGRLVVDWAGYLNLPDDLTHYEIVDGEVRVLPSPSVRHQKIVRQFMRILDPVILARQLGELLSAPLDLVIRRQPLRTRQPDLFFISSERLGAEGLPDDLPRLEIAPDLVIEVLSPSERYAEWKEKLQDYHAIGVREVWAVDTERREIEVLVHDAGGYRTLGWFAGEQPVQSTVLKEVRLKPVDIFEALGDSPSQVVEAAE